MGFKEVSALDTDTTVSLGGFNKKTNKANPKSIEGYYLGSRDGLPNKFNPEKPTSLHVFRTANGDVGVWGKTDLDRKMKAAVVGALTRVTQSGTRPSNKGNDMLVFKVEIDAENTIEVEAPVGATESSDEYPGAGYEDAEEDTLDDEAPMDEAPKARALPPKRAAATPDAARQAKVQALLSGRKA